MNESKSLSAIPCRLHLRESRAITAGAGHLKPSGEKVIGK
jgi:hypothetical protein